MTATDYGDGGHDERNECHHQWERTRDDDVVLSPSWVGICPRPIVSLYDRKSVSSATKNPPLDATRGHEIYPNAERAALTSASSSAVTSGVTFPGTAAMSRSLKALDLGKCVRLHR